VLVSQQASFQVSVLFASICPWVVSMGSSVVEQSSLDRMFEGSNPVAAGHGGEKIARGGKALEKKLA
jgi:hypothetical protein